MFSLISSTARFVFLLAVFIVVPVKAGAEVPTPSGSCSVPVQFSEIIATQTAPTDLRLSWQTSMQWECDFFEVLHSSSGIDWEVLGILKAAGNSDSTLSYEFHHRGAEAGGHYYKIRVRDLSSGSVDSKIVFARIDAPAEPAEVFPVPASKELLISGVDKGSPLLRVHGLYGRELTISYVLQAEGRAVMDVTALPAGVYFLKNREHTLRFVVER